tara:strand:- start:123 stop:515 length:393 start_codon:yes stop_codon:yes gene_type:complete
MSMDDKVLKKVKKISDKKDTEETLRNLKKGIQNTEETLKLGDLELGMIPEEIMKDLLKYKKQSNKDGGKQKLKDGKKTDFGMLSVKAGIDKNPKPTKADRIAGATMKDGSRTKVRGVRIANKGFRKAKLS